MGFEVYPTECYATTFRRTTSLSILCAVLLIYCFQLSYFYNSKYCTVTEILCGFSEIVDCRIAVTTIFLGYFFIV